MAESGNPNSVERLAAVNKILEGLKASYPDAKKLKIDISFNWAEVASSLDDELVPVVKIEMER